jgi:hypothetical protein
LAYPPAALFSFCLALGIANILEVVQTALCWAHGAVKVKAGISMYYLDDEIQGTYHGMMIAIALFRWSCFATSFKQLLDTLYKPTTHMRLADFLKHRRAPKKPKPRPKRDPKQGNVSPQRLLQIDFGYFFTVEKVCA